MATDAFSGKAGILATGLSFLTLGASQALYGPLLPHFVSLFGLSLPSAGLALSAHFLGAILGVILANLLLSHRHPRTVIIACHLLMAFGLLLFSLSPIWSICILSAFITGLGFGGVDFALSYFFSIGYNHKSAALLSLMNGLYGVGAFAAPFLVSSFGENSYRALFASIALLAAIPALGALNINAHFRDKQSTEDQKPAARPLNIYRITSLFFILYIFAGYIEAGVGEWSPLHLKHTGMDTQQASFMVSLFWLTLTLGRFLSAYIALRLSAERLIISPCIGMSLCLLATSIAPLAAYAYILCGIFVAPIYPLGIYWLNRIKPAARKESAAVFAVSMVGGVFFSPLAGLGIHHFGYLFLPAFFSGLAVACLVTAGCIHRLSRPAHR